MEKVSTARHASRMSCSIRKEVGGLSAFFIESFRSPIELVRQMMRRSPEDQNDPYMVGDLPLKRQKYLCEVLRREDGNQRVVNVDSDGESIFSYLAFSNGVSISDAASDLEKLQVILHLAVEKDDEGEQAEVILDAMDSWWRSHRIPFHEEIRAHWEQFVEALGNNTELEHFQMTSISFPPSPFFADSIVPILQDSSLTRLDLKDCNLGPSVFQGIA